MLALPAGIWLRILSFATIKDLKTMRLVSGNLCRLASVSFFASMDIFIGRFPLPSEQEDLIAIWHDEQEEMMTRFALEKLIRLHGRANPPIAHLVVDFRVVISTDHQLVFERYHIRSALTKMTGLKRFEWIGKPIPPDIAEQLVNTCPGITSLYLTQLDSLAAESLLGLTKLVELRLIDTNKGSAAIGLECVPHPRSLNSLISSNVNSLRRLCLNGEVAWGANLLRVADTLTHLSISNAGDCQGLDLFLRHAMNLESLTLLDLRTLHYLSADNGSIFLPNLQDMKLQMDLPVIGSTAGRNLQADTDTLRDFIASHQRLARCDFSMWPTVPGFVNPSSILEHNSLEWFVQVSLSLSTLQASSSIGLSFPPYLYMENEIRRLLETFPKSCTSLRLSGLTEVSPDIFLSYENVARQLTFLSWSNSRPQEYCEPKYRLPSISELLDTYHMDNLQSICLGNDMYDIDRDQMGEKRGVKWWEENKRLRKESNFCSADAHWLMSYRSLSEHYDFSRQPLDEMDDDSW